jgi:hypothetical protein
MALLANPNSTLGSMICHWNHLPHGEPPSHGCRWCRVHGRANQSCRRCMARIGWRMPAPATCAWNTCRISRRRNSCAGRATGACFSRYKLTARQRVPTMVAMQPGLTFYRQWWRRLKSSNLVRHARHVSCTPPDTCFRSTRKTDAHTRKTDAQGPARTCSSHIGGENASAADIACIHRPYRSADPTATQSTAEHLLARAEGPSKFRWYWHSSLCRCGRLRGFGHIEPAWHKAELALEDDSNVP